MEINADTLARLLRMVNPVEGAKGALDTLATIGGQAATQIPAGYAGLAEALRKRDLGAGAEEVERVQEKFGYKPRTERGAAGLQQLGKSVEAAEELVPEVAKRGWEKLTVASPESAAPLAAMAAVIDPLKLKRLKAAGKAAAKAPDADEALRGFGEAKAAREAAAGKRTVEQAGRKVERQKGEGTRSKTEPDVYRQMYREKGQEAVVEAAQRGEHLKPQPEGGYIGAPRNVQTGPQLGAMRRSFDEQINRAIDALNYADPERMGTWYTRAKAGQAAMHEPHQLGRGLEQTAEYSAGVAPDTELAFKLKHHTSRAIGAPGRAYRGAPAQRLDKAVAEGQPAKLAPKIGEYALKNDPRAELTGPFGVNDFRMAQAFGYTDPKGAMAKTVSGPMHPFMDAETALAVERANARGVQGKTDWTGAQMQELPWVLAKAEDIYGRGKKGRFAGGTEGMVAALREANKTVADFMPKHTMTLTPEAVPGASTQHVRQIPSGTPEERLAYSLQGRWDRPSPESATAMGMPESVGAGTRDALTRAQGMYQLPTRQAEGLYTNVLGGVESNPVSLVQPLVDFQTGGKGINPNTVNPETMKALRAQEIFRGAIDAQEAVAGNLPGTMESRKGKTSMLLESGRSPSAEELQNVGSLLEGGEGLFATPTSRGMHILNTSDNPQQAKALSDYLRSMAPIMEEAYPGSKAMPSGAQSMYEPVFTDWGSQPTQYGKGEVTTKVLEAMKDAPPNVARNLSESEEVRSIIAEKALRDSKLGGTRPDIQKMREFFTNEDWQRVVELMRKGAKPAAAMGALGYSLQGMAAPEQRAP